MNYDDQHFKPYGRCRSDVLSSENLRYFATNNVCLLTVISLFFHDFDNLFNLCYLLEAIMLCLFNKCNNNNANTIIMTDAL